MLTPVGNLRKIMLTYSLRINLIETEVLLSNRISSYLEYLVQRNNSNTLLEYQLTAYFQKTIKSHYEALIAMHATDDQTEASRPSSNNFTKKTSV